MIKYCPIIFAIIVLCFSVCLSAKTQINMVCDKMNTVFEDSEIYLTEMEGNIVVTSTDYTIYADYGIINHKTNIAQFEKNVRIVNKDFSSESNKGTFDY
ncbi:MAG: hypothetical protein KBT47_02800, partial [Armatimonadetes bacterium]|nr:hypothetical protein [Candidatus Hippobium faecium]